MATAKDTKKVNVVNGKVVVKAASDGVKPEPKKAVSIPTQKKQDNGKPEKPEQKKPVLKVLKMDRKELEPVLSVAKDFIEKKATMPVLTHIRMKTEKEGVLFAVTDLDKSWSKFLPGKGDDLDVCIPLDIFIREVRALHSDIKEVELKFIDNTVKVNGRCEIFILSGDNFPVLPERGAKQIDVPGFADKLARLLPAAGESDARYILNAVLIDFTAGYSVATDGHRLHFDRIPVHKEAGQIVISHDAAAVMGKHKAANTIRLGKKHISISLAGGIMTARLIEGTYPKYENVIPQGNHIRVTFQGPDFLKVLEGAIPVVADKGNAIRMTINGKIDIETSNPGIGNYKWHVPCTAVGAEKNFTVGFNAKYLADAIKAFTSKEDSKVTMTFKDPLSPCMINDRAVVMPMRT